MLNNNTAGDRHRRQAEAAARRLRFLNQASKLFRRKGFHKTSLTEIIPRSGGSRETLAKYFRNKAGLYATVIEQRAIEFVAGSHLPTLAGTPGTVLQNYGEMALRFFLTPPALRTYRDVISEGAHAPEVAAAFHRGAHGHIVKTLAAKLNEWQRQGLVSTPDPHEDAEFFLHLLRSGLHEQVLLGLRPRPTDAEIKAKAASATRLLLKGIGRRR